MNPKSMFLAAMMSLLLIGMVARSGMAQENADEAVYQLRIYVAADGKLDALNERFRDHTLKLFEKHGMENVGYWVGTDEADKTKLIYLLKHKNRDAAERSWNAFRTDAEWKAVASASRDKDGNLLDGKIDATYMVPTDYSPEVKSPSADKLYELRVYKAADDKLEDLHARFRDHTDDIFESHGMTALGYWSPTEGTKAGDVLIYILEYPDRDAAKASWQAFGKDPKWQAARKASEENGSLLAERPESIYMRPTNYSPTK